MTKAAARGETNTTIRVHTLAGRARARFAAAVSTRRARSAPAERNPPVADGAIELTVEGRFRGLEPDSEEDEYSIFRSAGAYLGLIDGSLDLVGMHEAALTSGPDTHRLDISVGPNSTGSAVLPLVCVTAGLACERLGMESLHQVRLVFAHWMLVPDRDHLVGSLNWVTSAQNNIKVLDFDIEFENLKPGSIEVRPPLRAGPVSVVESREGNHGSGVRITGSIATRGWSVPSAGWLASYLTDWADKGSPSAVVLRER